MPFQYRGRLEGGNRRKEREEKREGREEKEKRRWMARSREKRGGEAQALYMWPCACSQRVPTVSSCGIERRGWRDQCLLPDVLQSEEDS